MTWLLKYSETAEKQLSIPTPRGGLGVPKETVHFSYQAERRYAISLDWKPSEVLFLVRPFLGRRIGFSRSWAEADRP